MNLKQNWPFEAIKGQKSIAEIASEFGIHSTQINNWKK